MTQQFFYKVFFISLLLFSAVSQANAYPAYGYPNQQYPRQNTASPVDILENSINNVLRFLAQTKNPDTQQLKQYISNEIAPNFDFDYMARWVAGKRYYLMNKNQQKLFKIKFTEVFISSFVTKMTKNRKSLPRASRFRSSRQSQTEARASVLLTYYNSQRVKVDFRFFNTANGWKVVDVKANGMSALLYFRNFFANLIKQRQSK